MVIPPASIGLPPPCGETRTRKRRPWSAAPRLKVNSAARGGAAAALGGRAPGRWADTRRRDPGADRCRGDLRAESLRRRQCRDGSPGRRHLILARARRIVVVEDAHGGVVARVGLRHRPAAWIAEEQEL